MPRYCLNLHLQEQEDLSAQSAQREKAKADVQWMKQVGL